MVLGIPSVMAVSACVQVFVTGGTGDEIGLMRDGLFGAFGSCRRELATGNDWGCCLSPTAMRMGVA